jgi:hypothetical protein
VMCLAERLSEREKQQKEWSAGEGKKKFKASCYLSSTQIKKYPQHSHLLTWWYKIQVKGGRLIPIA